ncbi:MAG: DUF2194 domain-containing protein [Eubacteriales bacterium]|nr:DUF2194 domain-containing protein [Eubacteriales bacterium]
MNNYGRILLILLLFMTIIVNLQFARSGVLNDTGRYTNDIVDLVAGSGDAGAPGDTGDAAGADTEEPDGAADVADGEIKKTEFLVIYDAGDDISVRAGNNFRSLLTLYKNIPEMVEASDIAAGNGPDYSGFLGIIVAVRRYSAVGDYSGLLSYAAAGGSVFFACPGEAEGLFDSLMSPMGIYEASAGGTYDYVIDRKGIFGEKGRAYLNTGGEYYYRSPRLRSECEVYFVSEKGAPLLWKATYGEGRIFAANSDFVSLYTGRGVASAILAEMRGDRGMLYPVYGLITAHLESFPGPAITGEYKILREVRKDYDRFVKDVLWPDMIKLSREFDLKYTISYVQSYSSETAPPVPDSSLPESSLLIYGAEVLDKGGEIALHGYSYRPFGLDGELRETGWFIPWDSMESMKLFSELPLKLLKKLFPGYTARVYFPPEGRMGRTARENILMLMKDISVICVPYHNILGDQLDGDFLTRDDGIMHYAVTSGVKAAEWNAINSVYSLGIISQSIDIPYAIVSDYRSWDQLLYDMRNAFNIAKKMIPFVRTAGVSSAAAFIRKYEMMDFSYESSNDGIRVSIDGFFKGMSFMLRSDRQISGAEGAEVYEAGRGLWCILPETGSFLIKWGGGAE